VVGKRYYDAAGNLIQRHFRESLSGTFINPDTGRTAAWIQHDTVIHNLAVPGDPGTGTIRLTGLLTRAWLPGGGTVMMNAGWLAQDAATGDVVAERGPQPLNDYFTGSNPAAISGLCAAVS